MTTKPGAGAAAAALTSLERLSRDGVPLLEASREAECGVRSAEGIELERVVILLLLPKRATATATPRRGRQDNAFYV